jgi:hypothetical protein
MPSKSSPPARRRRSSCSFDGFAQTRQQWQQRVQAIEEEKTISSRRRSSLSMLPGKPASLELPSSLRSEAATMPSTPRKLSFASKEPFEGVPYSAPDLSLHGQARTARVDDKQQLPTAGAAGTPEQVEGGDDEAGALLSEQQLIELQQHHTQQQQQQQQQQEHSAEHVSATAPAVDQKGHPDSAVQPDHGQDAAGAAFEQVQTAHIAEQQHTDALLQAIGPPVVENQKRSAAKQVTQDSREQLQTAATDTAAGAQQQQHHELVEQTAVQQTKQQQVEGTDAAAADDVAADSDDELFFDAATAELPQQQQQQHTQLSAAASTTIITAATAASASAQHSALAATAATSTQTVEWTVGPTVGQQKVTLPSPFFNFTLTEGGTQILAECARLRAQARAADARSAALQARLTAKEYVLQAVLQRSEEQQRMHAEQCW